MSDMFSDNVNKTAEKLAAQNPLAESVNESQQNPPVPSTRLSTGQIIGQSIVSTQVTLQYPAMNIKILGLYRLWKIGQSCLKQIGFSGKEFCFSIYVSSLHAIYYACYFMIIHLF